MIIALWMSAVGLMVICAGSRVFYMLVEGNHVDNPEEVIKLGLEVFVGILLLTAFGSLMND